MVVAGAWFVVALAMVVESPTIESPTIESPTIESPTIESPDISARPPEPPRFVEPRRVVGRERRPTRRTTTRFTDRPPLIRPALRVAPGFSARWTGRPYAAFGFDALASVMFGLHGGRRQLGLAPEVGYSLRAPGLDHQLLGGLGLVYGINVEHWSVAWLPRAVLQPATGGMGLGARNGLWFDFAENGFSVELSHQWLRMGGADTQELRVTLGLDLMMLVLVFTDLEVAWL